MLKLLTEFNTWDFGTWYKSAQSNIASVHKTKESTYAHNYYKIILNDLIYAQDRSNHHLFIQIYAHTSRDRLDYKLIILITDLI